MMDIPVATCVVVVATQGDVDYILVHRIAVPMHAGQSVDTLPTYVQSFAQHVLARTDALVYMRNMLTSHVSLLHPLLAYADVTDVRYIDGTGTDARYILVCCNIPASVDLACAGIRVRENVKMYARTVPVEPPQVIIPPREVFFICAGDVVHMVDTALADMQIVRWRNVCSILCRRKQKEYVSAAVNFDMPRRTVRLW